MIKRLQKTESRLRLAIAGPAGSGKTYSSLLIASGLVDDNWDKICIIDTERGSANCYADKFPIFGIVLEPPFKPEKYIASIKEAEAAGMEVIIIDSLSHAWAGEGGLLDQHGQIADKMKNSFTAWREVTPMHNRLVDTMLQSKCHIIATLRTKTEYVVEDGGKKIRKVGLAPIQRDGLEYEFTIFGDLSPTHLLTVSKDRTGLFQDQSFLPDADMGRKIKTWLASSPTVNQAESTEPVQTEQTKPANQTEVKSEPTVKAEPAVQAEPAGQTESADAESLVVIIVDSPQEGFAPAANIETDQEIVLNLSRINYPVQVGLIYEVHGKYLDTGDFLVEKIIPYSEETGETVELQIASNPKEAATETVDGEKISGFAAKAKIGDETITIIGDLKKTQKGTTLKVAVLKKTAAKSKTGEEVPIWVVSPAS